MLRATRYRALREAVALSFLRLYLRVLGLLAPERKLAISLALANLALAGVFFLEPVLFGRVVDALAAPSAKSAPRLIAWWAAVGFGGVLAGVWVSLHAIEDMPQGHDQAVTQLVRTGG